MYIRFQVSRDWGDYEQTVPEIYSQVNYLELYILGASGTNRNQLHVYNQYDPCCFAGPWHTTYDSIISERVRSLGAGHFDVYLDSSYGEHIVSASALDAILADMEE